MPTRSIFNDGKPWVTMVLVLVPVAILLVLAFRMSAGAGEMVRQASTDDRPADE